MANQNGWLLLSPQEITVEWDGSDRTRGLKISSSEPSNRLIAKSHFGSGIVTWTLPWLFRTSPGYNLLIRGPSNIPKDGIYPLEGLVETDWSITSFTMNWKVTRPHVPITFEQGEPFAMILPQRRHELEQVVPQERSINDDPELKKAFMEWSKSRGQFMRDLKQPGTDAAKQVWQRHYTQGKSPSGMMAPEHQTRMHLKDFEPG
jgi:hypothetical protein